MTENRPIIFLYPLSSSLKKYLELVQETHEEEAIDIYEVDVLNEAAQLIPTLGPCVILASSPKKCAQMLQQNKQALKRNSSKVLLLSEKELPHKIIHKLQKFGLTEYLKEPVNPKSLIYKVSLLLKSLPVITNKEEEKEEQVFSSDEETSQATDQKQRVEKGIIFEEETEEDEKTDNKEVTLDIQSEDEAPTEEINLLDLASDLKKDVMAPLEIEIENQEEVEEELKPEVDHIETYYKSTQEEKIDLEVTEDEATPKEKSENEEDALGDEVHLLDNSDFAMDFEKKETEEITIDEVDTHSDTKKETNEETSLDLQAVGDGLSKEEVELNLKTEESQVDDSDENEGTSLEDELIKHRAEVLLDISEEDAVVKEDVELILGNEKEDSKEEEEDDTQADIYKVNKKEELQIEAAEKTPEKIDAILNLDSAEETSKDDTSEEVSIRNEIKSKSNNSILELDADEDENAAEEIEFDEDIYGKNENDKKLESEAKEIAKRKQNSILELGHDDDDDESDNEQEDKEGSVVLTDSDKLKIEESNKKKNDDSRLDLESGKERKDSEIDIDLQGNKEGTNPSEELQSIDADQKVSSNATTLNLDSAKKKKLKELELMAGETRDRKDEQETTSYDWSKEKKARSDEDFGPWISKKKKTIEINFDKKDKSEQTIDYRQLKKQFDNASLLERERGGRSETGIEQTGNSKETRKGGANQEYSGEEDIDSLSTQDEEDEIIKEVFEPDSRGVEFIVRTLQMFLDGRNDKQIYLYLSNTIYKEFKGIVGFFVNNKESGIAEEVFSAAHNIEYSGNRDELIAKWEKLKEENRSAWSNVRLPEWQDEKFQADENQFIYPFFEGIDRIGHIAVNFPEGINQKDSSKIEMTLEGSRAIYLEKQRESGAQVSYKSATDEKPIEEKKGLLGKFFGKKK